MKSPFTFLTYVFLFFALQGLHSQPTGFNGSIPLKPQSPLFGKDIIIDNQPLQNQSDVAIGCAFNGWLYAVTTYYDSIDHTPGYDLLQSKDSGMTWQYLTGSLTWTEYLKIRSNSITIMGDSISNLKIFWSYILLSLPSELGGSEIFVFNGETGDYLYKLPPFFGGNIDIKVVSDYTYPTIGSNPHSLGELYSIDDVNPLYGTIRDSIIFLSSSDGGKTMNNKQVLATSTNSHFRKVTLNYGRSASYPTGRYFAAWEEIPNQSSTTGHIYTSHSDPDFNSAFTKPVCLDSLDATAINKVRNPSIACQYSDNDNSNGNLTEMVIFEKFMPSTSMFGLEGFYNLQAATTHNFNEFTVSSSATNQIEPWINFNPYNSTFLLTYFDSTDFKLPLLSNDVNLGNPSGWNVINQAYNDNDSLTNPNPRENINVQKQNGMNVWISQKNSSNGVALFDAQYSTWTGVTENNMPNQMVFQVYPNPCNSNITVSFDLPNPSDVSITIYNLMGQTAGVITNQNYTSGKYQLKCNVANLLPGSYICSFRAGEVVSTAKLTVIR